MVSPRQLTHTGTVNVDPHWSSDGNSILCTSSASGKGFGLWQVWPKDGSMQPVLADDHQNITPTWSKRNANRIRQQSRVARKGNRRNRRNLGSSPRVKKIPPSYCKRKHFGVRDRLVARRSEIAFISFRSGNNQLWLMNAIAGNPLQLTFSNGEVFDPSWSPMAGNRLCFRCGRSPYALDNSNGWRRSFPGSDYGLKYNSPVGRVEVMVRDENGQETAARVYL